MMEKSVTQRETQLIHVLFLLGVLFLKVKKRIDGRKICNEVQIGARIEILKKIPDFYLEIMFAIALLLLFW